MVSGQAQGLSGLSAGQPVAHLSLTADDHASARFSLHLPEEVRAHENNPRKPAQDRGLCTDTLQGYARTLKAFFSWTAREGYLASDPAKALRIPKGMKAIVKTLSDAQVRSLLSVIDPKSPKGFRDYCLLLVLLDTGIRLSELVNLQAKDIGLDRGFLKKLGKAARKGNW